MDKFLEYCPFDGKRPPSTGAYNIVIVSRDNVPVISVAYYDASTKKWYRQQIEEYGYSEQFQMDDNFISYFKEIEGVGFNVVPESYVITISGMTEEDEE